ncbi:hypothetical protein ACFYYS_25825 [Streptomyces sp. NPDC002120]|uniref:hypothetical protein n=1 Tax=Streptomyces sp. NPDC002120 TaxID=3364631 RepID=UPI0036A4EF37
MDKKDTTFVDKALEDKAFADQLMGDKALADELIAALITDKSLGDRDFAQLVMTLWNNKGTFHEGMMGLADRATRNEDLNDFMHLILALQVSTVQWPKPAAEDILSPTSGVYVFTDRNCQGKHAGFGGGRHDMADIARQIGNDAISSLSIAKGWGITLFTGAGFSGDKTTIAPRRDGVGGDRYNLTDGFDNAVSSFIITGVPRDPSRQHQVTSTYHGSATGYTPAEGQKGYSD